MLGCDVEAAIIYKENVKGMCKIRYLLVDCIDLSSKPWFVLGVLLRRGERGEGRRQTTDKEV